MLLHRKLMFCLLLVVIISTSGTAWCGTRAKDGDPDIIGAAVQKPNGSTATLSCVLVKSLGKSGKSFTLYDKSSIISPPRLIIVSTHQLPVKEGWSLDIQGTLSTLSSDDTTQKVLITNPSNISVFCSLNGKPMIMLPPGINWPYKRTLSELTANMISDSSQQLSAMDNELPPLPDDESGTPAPPAVGSRDSLKWLPDGVSVSISNAVITSVRDGYFYAVKSDDSFGIRVNSSATVDYALLVDVTGTMSTVNGERCIIADNDDVNADWNNYYYMPFPIGMTNKVMGGGAVGTYTPAVADAAGLNNTGQMVKVWGHPTAAFYSSTAGCNVFYIDDGSGVTADNDSNSNPYAGIKIYDYTSDSLPTPGSTNAISVTGISSTEIPSGSSESIRTLIKDYFYYPDMPSSGNATISGSVTAAGSNGTIVKVSCDGAFCNTSLNNGSASYTLHVKSGDHLVTASVLGNKTTAHLVSVSDGQNAAWDFTLESIATVIDVIPAQSRIAPDGTSETTVTAIVRDMEGRRFPNQSVTWSMDTGTLVSDEATTNAVGEATAIIRSSTNHETATVTVQAGSIVEYGFVQYGIAGDPSIRITNLAGNQVVSGTLEIRVSCNDTNEDGISDIYDRRMFIDGVNKGRINPATDGNYVFSCETSSLTNGAHTLAVQAKDRAGNLMTSNIVNIDVINYISNIKLSQMDLFYNESNPQPFIISGELSSPDTWVVEIKDMRTGNTVYSDSGYSNGSFQTSWDGKVNGSYNQSIYNVNVKRSNDPDPALIRAVTINRSGGGALICGKYSGEEADSQKATFMELFAWADACATKYVPYTIVLDPLWETGYNSSDMYGNSTMRKGIKEWLGPYHQYRYFFFTGHGYYGDRADDGHHHVNVDMNGDTVYGTDEWSNTPDTEYAFSDLSLKNDGFRIVWFNSCNSAGSASEPDLSLANAFGCYDLENDGTFIGWLWMYYPTSYEIKIPCTYGAINFLSSNGTGWTTSIAGLLGDGYSVGQAEYLYYLHTTFNPSESGYMSIFRYIYGPTSKWVSWLVP